MVVYILPSVAKALLQGWRTYFLSLATLSVTAD